jgi:apolipoprotein N-acyltransferase
MIWSFLLSLSFYPGFFGFLAWFSLIRPLMIISSLKGRPAFNAAYFFGFFFNLFSLYWVAQVTIPGILASIIIVAFYYAAILVIFNKVYRFRPLFGCVAVPFLWVGMEYFRTLSQFAFPWSDLGYSQAYYLNVLQIVSVIGAHGLSFVIVAVNVLLWQVFRSDVSPERRVTAVFVSLAIVGGLWSYGWIEMPKYPVPGKFKVALLQGNVPLDVKWERGNEFKAFSIYNDLTGEIADSTVGLYIWPETAVPCYLTHDLACRTEVGNIAIESKSYDLVGGLGASYIKGKMRYFNSCFQFNKEGRMESRYDKVKLVPFSEHVPYQDYLGFLEQDFLRKYLTFIGTTVQWWSDFYPGDSAHLFKLPDHLYAVLICFESTFPEFVRGDVLSGADFLVGITNDTWFGKSVGIYMHSRIFVTRCVENRIWGARVGNSGLTYIVDNYGRIRESIPIYRAESLIGKLNSLNGYSVFTRYGDVVGRWSFLLTISISCILIALWILAKFSHKRSQS